jgi:hypothetical protein
MKPQTLCYIGNIPEVIEKEQRGLFKDPELSDGKS